MLFVTDTAFLFPDDTKHCAIVTAGRGVACLFPTVGAFQNPKLNPNRDARTEDHNLSARFSENHGEGGGGTLAQTFRSGTLLSSPSRALKSATLRLISAACREALIQESNPIVFFLFILLDWCRKPCATCKVALRYHPAFIVCGSVFLECQTFLVVPSTPMVRVSYPQSCPFGPP